MRRLKLTIVPSLIPGLQGPPDRVDTQGMSLPEQTLPPFDASCLAVLSCYAVRDAAAKTSRPEYSGWLDRIIEIPGLDPSSLTSIHGYLIAQGLIRFEFTGRSVGLQYQLSPIGRESVSRGTLNVLDDPGRPDASFEGSADSKSQAA